MDANVAVTQSDDDIDTDRVWYSEPRWLRKLLSTPIRLNRIPEADRQKEEARRTARRERALFELYHIPADWPDSIRWERLARHLAGELFAGCRTMPKQKGGPSRRRRVVRKEQLRTLLQQFEAFRATKSGLNPQRAAELFVKDNRQACTDAGFKAKNRFGERVTDLTTAKGLIRAWKKISAETGASSTCT